MAQHAKHPVRNFLRAGIGMFALTAAVLAFGQIQKARIFQDDYPLITETDLYCSFFILEDPMPEILIVGAERGEEKNQFSDGDIMTINAGRAEGLEVGRVFEVLDAGVEVQSLGRLMHRRGRVRVILTEEHTSLVQAEKTCFPMRVGSRLVPFIERETVIGRNLGFDPTADGASGAAGKIVFMDNDTNILANGDWALIDVGREAGVEPGTQMTIFRPTRGDGPRDAVGNAVVIDAATRSATVKILSSRDAIEMGFIVQAKSAPLS